MTLDFVKVLLYSDGKEIMAEPETLNVYASMLGVEDLDYSDFVDKKPMIRWDYAEKRLESLVVRMINNAAEESYDKDELLILREFYGIRRHRLSALQIMEKYHIESIERFTGIIESAMLYLGLSRLCEPWRCLLKLALFLPAEPWRLFMRRLRSCARNKNGAELCWRRDEVLALYKWILKEV